MRRSSSETKTVVFLQRDPCFLKATGMNSLQRENTAYFVLFASSSWFSGATHRHGSRRQVWSCCSVDQLLLHTMWAIGPLVMVLVSVRQVDFHQFDFMRLSGSIGYMVVGMPARVRALSIKSFRWLWWISCQNEHLHDTANVIRSNILLLIFACVGLVYVLFRLN